MAVLVATARTAIAVLTALAVTAGCASPPAGSAGRTRATQPATTSQPNPHESPLPRTDALARLAGLTVAPARSVPGYSRDRFPHWTDHGDGCDTRDLVLKRDGEQVKNTGTCTVVSGRWYSPYDGKTLGRPKDLDIDHVVPLANAWRSGAAAWDDARRSEFANDLVRPQLLAVSAATNRGKRDQDPSSWQPPNQGFWCQYAQSWILVKTYWRLTVTSTEKAGLTTMVNRCS